jgi:hypothetical protein
VRRRDRELQLEVPFTRFDEFVPENLGAMNRGVLGNLMGESSVFALERPTGAALPTLAEQCGVVGCAGANLGNAERRASRCGNRFSASTIQQPIEIVETLSQLRPAACSDASALAAVRPAEIRDTAAVDARRRSR